MLADEKLQSSLEHCGLLTDLSAPAQTRQALLRGIWRCVHAHAAIRCRGGGWLAGASDAIVGGRAHRRDEAEASKSG